MPSKSPYFDRAFFRFLEDLRQNNQREWFQANKRRYEDEVREPAQQFISDFGPELRKISPHFLADPRPSGGSMFRIYRDTRFSKDKTPYKTHVGIQFRHKQGKDVHAPGFYLHLEPGESFAGLGVWHPEPPTLERIRQAIVDDPGGYRKAIGAARFKKRFKLEGDSLKRPPRSYDPDHPLIEELKRKDFVGACPIDEKDVVRPGFDRRLAEVLRDGAGYVRYLCRALGAPF